jgi:hypothetical protein
MEELSKGPFLDITDAEIPLSLRESMHLLVLMNWYLLDITLQRESQDTG